MQAKRPSHEDRSALNPLVTVLNKFIHFAYINFEHMLTTMLTTISFHIHWNERGSYFANLFECWSSKRNLSGTVINWPEVSQLQSAVTYIPWHRLLAVGDNRIDPYRPARL